MVLLDCPPLPPTRMRHKGALISAKGVSALCFKSPRAIDMKRATWTSTDSAVTCPKCIAAMKSTQPTGGDGGSGE